MFIIGYRFSFLQLFHCTLILHCCRDTTQASIATDLDDGVTPRGGQISMSSLATASVATESRSRGVGASHTAASIATASVATESARSAALRTMSSINTESITTRSRTTSKSDSVPEEIHSEKGLYQSIFIIQSVNQILVLLA